MNFAESLIDLLHYLQSPSDTYKVITVQITHGFFLYVCLFVFIFICFCSLVPTNVSLIHKDQFKVIGVRIQLP